MVENPTRCDGGEYCSGGSRNWQKGGGARRGSEELAPRYGGPSGGAGAKLPLGDLGEAEVIRTFWMPLGKRLLM